ncbi:MAG: hypothetical protein ACW96X_05035 [Promethearchaeota archaeon]|jgi:hypothetical protein
MVKKGKYQLLSYLVDRYLIFYKSLNRNKKIIAFAMFDVNSYNQIIPILNEFLKKRFIQYYSIQLNTIREKKPFFILNFEDTKKENIVRLFNIIHQNFTEKNLHIKFHIDSILEQKFIELILKKVDSNTSITKLGESLLVVNNGNSLQLDFFTININKLDNQDSFVHNLINIINNFNKKGYLIINFLCNNDEEIKFTLYFTELTHKKDESFSTENNINSFFNYSVFKRQGLKIKEFHNYFWRKGISDNFFLLKYYSQLFQNNSSNDTHDLLVFNQDFERTLLKNNVKFIRFSNYLLFIEQTFLFLTMSELKSRFIQQIIQKYRSKYFIYILVLNQDDSKKLSEIKSFKSLKNVQILNLDEISKFNLNTFR